ncbi:MAG: hypothetical protein KGR48_17330 [Alphaproteobacteria bacterium]|nr:hypothetical protein [Alphaproteobacteria bacterium]MDE2014702.1 hypothetical protein [Alphaproteobacteria bacterium]MDE2074892.1 hypothetical protein [Alphaproteobacteria bacterium]
MARLSKGIFAGFIATIVLSLLMIMKAMMGMMPNLNVIAMLTHMSGASSPLVGWVMHFMIGSVVWGGLFALLYDRIPGGSALMKGIVFGVGAWLLMMVMVMPMAGAGLFGMNFGMAAPVMTLMLHIIFGMVLGLVYGFRAAPAPANS